MDKIIKATAKDGMVRIIAGQTRELVNEGITLHNCSPVAAAALGRMLTAGALMGSTLKGKNEVLTLKIDGNGEAKGITVTAHEGGKVKGLVGNPYSDRPLNSIGKLDVGGFIGKDGDFIVIKDLGLREPYIGRVPIYTGEIAEDLAYYFTVSEQTPSAVALGVLVDKDLSIKTSGGFIIQMMPDADELLSDLITYRLQEIPSITEMLLQYGDITKVIEFIFEGMDLKILEEITPEYKCNCSRERVEKALISIGKKELSEIYEEGKEEEIKCDFCNAIYRFNKEDIGELLKQAK
ncbi:Hsp33 family molecular chaperone HslO [Clostridium isatidis]|uniref:33 kDa chaperonin n=1 Tax=Clostridium isatidis TaxID=182773 RepID=A0A343JAR3_9CLOT|nr:Hsp33 family molecular chaperone HslO [Clostridium isatidis]ASW42621.1 Hsp33 family molecular chaperone [Clostridium isatidis]NLZ33472.1 Hsp33 family molecular chaperone HslO [Clostridiales bacterium]